MEKGMTTPLVGTKDYKHLSKKRRHYGELQRSGMNHDFLDTKDNRRNFYTRKRKEK